MSARNSSRCSHNRTLCCTAIQVRARPSGVFFVVPREIVRENGPDEEPGVRTEESRGQDLKSGPALVPVDSSRSKGIRTGRP